MLSPDQAQERAHDIVRRAAAAGADAADAVFAAGWSEEALHHVIAITARAAFMQRLVEGHGFVPMSREVAAERARRRLEEGYVNLDPAFRKKE